MASLNLAPSYTAKSNSVHFTVPRQASLRKRNTQVVDFQNDEHRQFVNFPEKLAEHTHKTTISIRNVDAPSFQGPMQSQKEEDAKQLSKIVVSLSRSNNLSGALSCYKRIEEFGLVPTLHASNSLIAALLRKGLYEDAVTVFERMTIKTSPHTFSLVAKAVAKSQGWEKAFRLWSEMQSLGSMSLDIIGYNTMVSVCGKAQRWEEVHLLWERMKQEGCKESLVTYRLLLSTFVQCNKLELALKVYSDMVKDDIKPNGDMMKGLVCVCAKEGQWSLALDFFRQMVDLGYTPNKITYNILISSLCKACKVELALKLYKHMQITGHSADVYTLKAIFSGLNRSDQFKRALGIFESLRESKRNEMDAKIYNEALVACQKLGLWQRAMQYLWEMERLGMEIQASSYNLVIRACEVARKPEVAIEVYHHMKNVNCSPNAFTYLSIIRLCGQGSFWEELKQVIEEVSYSRIEQDPLMCDTLIQTLCSYGKIKWAKCLYQRMLRHGHHPNLKTAFLVQNCNRRSSITDEA